MATRGGCHESPSARARRLIADGRAWVDRIAEEHVPKEFRSSFLHRNPVNLALLARAAPPSRAK